MSEENVVKVEKVVRKSGEPVEIYDVSKKVKVQVPAASCTLRKLTTARGARNQVVGKVTNADGTQREVFAFVAKDFVL